jgi:hypothetical protein
LLLNANSEIFQLYHDENKFNFQFSTLPPSNPNHPAFHRSVSQPDTSTDEGASIWDTNTNKQNMGKSFIREAECIILFGTFLFVYFPRQNTNEYHYHKDINDYFITVMLESVYLSKDL